MTLFLVTSSDFYVTFFTGVLSARGSPRGLHHIKSGNVSPSIVITNPLEAKLLDLCWILTCLSVFPPLFTHLSQPGGQTHAKLSVLFSFPFCWAFFASNKPEITTAFRGAIKN